MSQKSIFRYDGTFWVTSGILEKIFNIHNWTVVILKIFECYQKLDFFLFFNQAGGGFRGHRELSNKKITWIA